MRYSALVILSCCLVFAVAIPQPKENTQIPGDGSDSNQQLPPLVIPVFPKEDMNRELTPIGTPAASNRTGRFFGLTTGASGNNLQLGLSFIIPFLNIPFGSYGSSSSSSIYGTSNYGTSNYGSGTTSLLGINSSSIIWIIVIAIAAVIFIPFLIYSTTGVSTSPFGRSDDIQGMLTNLASRVEDALLQYNIDAPSCLQRAVCTYVKQSTKRMAEGDAGSMEKIIEGLATNSYINTILDGTKLQRAIDTGRKPGTPCSGYFVKCPYNVRSLYEAIYAYANQVGQQQQGQYNSQSNDVPTQ